MVGRTKVNLRMTDACAQALRKRGLSGDALPQAVEDAVLGQFAEVERLREEVVELKRIVTGTEKVLESQGVKIERTEDGHWTWTQRVVERARNGDREHRRAMGGYTSQWKAIQHAFRALDEQYAAWRKTVDL